MSEVFGNSTLFRGLSNDDATLIREAVAAGASLDVADPIYGSPLIFAIISERPELVDLLLELGANVNLRAGRNSALLEACTRGDRPIVQRLLAHGADPNLTRGLDAEPLIAAIANEHVAIVKLLLEAGADPTVKNRFGVNALSLAASCRKASLTSLLSEAAQNAGSRLTLVEAARFGHLPRVRALIEQHPRAQELPHAAAIAIHAGHTAILDALLDAGLDPNRRGTDDTSDPWSLLGHAASVGNLNAVQRLLAAGAQIDAPVTPHAQGPTALHLAAAAGKLPIVKALIEAGANPAHRDAHGLSPLSQAQRAGYKRVIAFLESRLSASSELPTLLDAARDGMVDAVRKRLAEPSCDLALCTPTGETSLHLALRGGHVDAAAALLEAGADLNATNRHGTPAWAFAFSDACSPPLIQALFDAGWDPGRRVGPDGMTALHLAAMSCRSQAAAIVASLVDAGADLQATFLLNSPRPGRTSREAVDALQFARRAGNRAFAKALQQRSGAPLDPYDRALAALASFKQPTDAFCDLARRLGEPLHCKPTPWKRRAGVFQYFAALRHLKTEPAPAPADGDDALLATLAPLQALAQSQGACLVFNSLPETSEARCRLLLFPTTDPLVMMAACGTNGVNAGFGTREVIAWFAERLEAHPLAVTGCGFDFVEVQFAPVPPPEHTLAGELFAFCPDLEPGAGPPWSPDGRVFLWWD